MYVSSITPNVGSVRGGTVVTVYGDGFRFEIYFNEISGSYFQFNCILSKNCSMNTVTFGSRSCNVLECSESWIKCQTTNYYMTYHINNSASDPCLCLCFIINITVNAC